MNSKNTLSPDNIGDTVDELPEPSGYRLLVLPFTPKEKTKGGILLHNWRAKIVKLTLNYQRFIIQLNVILIEKNLGVK